MPDGLTEVALRSVNHQSYVELQLSGKVFASHNGPVPAKFDKAEIWLGERPDQLTYAFTTDSTTVRLNNLKPNTLYFIASKGTRGSVTTPLSEPIVAIRHEYSSTNTIAETAAGASTRYFSPDGKKVAYLEGKDVLVKDLTQNTLLATIGSGFVRGWSSNSDRLFLEQTSGKDRKAAYYDVGGKAVVSYQLPSQVRLWDFKISPDGKSVAYKDYNRSGLFLFNEKEAAEKRFYPSQLFSSVRWTWHSDGTRLLYYVDGVSGKGLQQFDISSGQSGAFPIALHYAVDFPEMSPSGRYLLFSSNLAGAPDVWLLDIENQVFRQYPQGFGFSWQADDSFIVATKSTGNSSPLKYIQYRVE
ncbi:hypothetical protein [Telluribacter sp.]|jgi:Tol biopolymer transport system component|uniref:TolB family protein n=1 Tax=Telluribacter sp. TaxID=1978767 RepID=UPI002E166078|nr:hypothetical protein [Telluribacter sp.]